MQEEVLCLRDGKDALVISSGLAGCFHLPPRCVVCNVDAPGGRIRKTLGQRSLVALTPIMSATAGYDLEIEFTLCAQHARRRWTLLALGVVLFLGGIPIAALQGSLVFYVLGVAMMLAAIILVVTQYRIIRLVEIDAVQAKIRVGEPFAQSFAEDLGGGPA